MVGSLGPVMQELVGHLRTHDYAADNRFVWRKFLSRLPDRRRETVYQALANYFGVDASVARENYRDFRREYTCRILTE